MWGGGIERGVGELAVIARVVGEGAVETGRGEWGSAFSRPPTRGHVWGDGVGGAEQF